MNDLLTPILLETKISKLNSLKEFNKYLKQFPSADPYKIKEGLMYSYSYDFYKDYEEEVIKYFDEMPLVIMLKFWPQRNLWLGLNTHFLPVLNRASFIRKLQGMNPQAFKKDGFNKVRISYLTIQSIMKKSKFCVRWYRPEAISNLKVIPNKEWINASQYQPSTFYKVDVEAVMQRHKDYPTSSKKKTIKESLDEDFDSDFEIDSEDEEENEYPIF